MTKQPLGRVPRRFARRRKATALLVSLAILSAVTTVRVLPSARGVAMAGPVLTLPAESVPLLPGELPEVTSPDAAQPVTASVPVGPHLVVPILMYHYVRDIAPDPHNLLGFNLSISPQLFAAQMALLRVEGATPITLSMLMDALAGERRLPAHPVVLTFDDGYADFATAALPVLARYGFVATDFVVSGFIGRPRYMSVDQVRSTDAQGMVIGSHTIHHVDLAALPLAAARTEIDGGKASLEALLGHPVLDFAYPYGGFNATVEQLVEQAGFRDAVTTRGGDIQTLGGRFVMRRTEVGGAPSLAVFAEDACLPVPTVVQAAEIAAEARQPVVPTTV